MGKYKKATTDLRWVDFICELDKRHQGDAKHQRQNHQTNEASAVLLLRQTDDHDERPDDGNQRQQTQLKQHAAANLCLRDTWDSVPKCLMDWIGQIGPGLKGKTLETEIMFFIPPRWLGGVTLSKSRKFDSRLGRYRVDYYLDGWVTICGR